MIPDEILKKLNDRQKEINIAVQIVDIEEALPHKMSEVMCVNCKERWYCVRPTRTPLSNLECTDCGKGFVIETGQDVDSEN